MLDESKELPSGRKMTILYRNFLSRGVDCIRDLRLSPFQALTACDGIVYERRSAITLLMEGVYEVTIQSTITGRLR